MKIKSLSIATLVISIIGVAICCSAFSHSQEAALTSGATVAHGDTFYLGSTGYLVVVPDGYYMTGELYPGFVKKAEDTDEYFCFFPLQKDSVCRTRLLINFTNQLPSKTGYPMGTEFYLTDTVLGKEVTFLDHSICMRAYRHRSGMLTVSSGSYIHIMCEAGDTTSMKELYGAALSLAKKP